MTPLEFRQGLDRWGADLEQWPAAQAARAGEHLAAHESARRELAAARQVDGFLERLRPHATPAHLAARIVARTGAFEDTPAPVDRLLAWLGARLWRPALIALMVTSAGFLAGMTMAQPAVDTQLADDVMTLAFSDIYAELEDAQP